MIYRQAKRVVQIMIVVIDVEEYMFHRFKYISPYTPQCMEYELNIFKVMVLWCGKNINALYGSGGERASARPQPILLPCSMAH
jgi:hypothetical protein